MNRSVFAIAPIAVALSSAAFTTAAEACISCEYVPEVVRQHATGSDQPAYRSRGYAVRSEPGARARRTARQYREREDAKPAKAARVEKPDRRDKIDKRVKAGQRTLASKAPRLSEEIKAHAAPSQSGPSVASVATGSTVPARSDRARVETENSSIALSAVRVVQERVSAVATSAHDGAGKPSDCKKFFPSVAMTLTVPCE
ncbi:MAG TPA: hypothetical protein VFF87_04435 [Hyphomicrobium sp.]|nr:hypothetical protein [Hyphomicrobium sp.]